MPYYEFQKEFTRVFKPMTDAKLAHQSLKGFKQTGKVTLYVTRFHELVQIICNMIDEDKYHTFMKAQKPNIQQMVGQMCAGT